MQTLAIDFETYYDKNYSLKKMSTQEYVFDPRFEVIGVSVQIDTGEPAWFTGDHAATLKWLGEFDWANSLAIAHNAMFDALILEEVFGIHPMQWYCTMMASRPNVVPFTGKMSLDAVSTYYGAGTKGGAVSDMVGLTRVEIGKFAMLEYAAYCNQDVRLCHSIFRRTAVELPLEEIKLIDLTIKKFCRPKLVLDKNLIAEEIDTVVSKRELLMAKAAVVTGVTKFGSNPRFAEYLESKGIMVGTKQSPATGQRTFALAKTDQFMIDLGKHPDYEIRLAVEARLASKSNLTVTRLKKFFALAEQGCALSIPLLYYGAHTGRFSGLDGLNFQNLPRGSILRRAMMAPTGYKIVAGDLSQIEARLVAVLAEQWDLVKAFAEGRDVYCEFASIIYGRPITKADELERFIGKNCILSLGYGAGALKFWEAMKAFGVDMEFTEAQRIVDLYRKTYYKIPLLWKTLNNNICQLKQDEYSGVLYTLLKFGYDHILLPNEMKIWYPELRFDAKGFKGWSYIKGGRMRTKVYGGSLLENIGQGLARIVIRDAEIAMAKHGALAVNQIHDELLYVVADNHVENVSKALELALTAPVEWMPELPVACEIAVGDNYAEAK